MSGPVGDNVYKSSGVIATATATGGAWEYIARQTLGSDTAAIEFINGTAATDGTPDFSSTYSSVCFNLSPLIPATNGAQPNIQMSTDAGSTYLSADYLAGLNYVDATTGAVSNTALRVTGGSFRLGTSTWNDASAGLNGFLYLENPSSTTAYPSIWWQFNSLTSATNVYVNYGSAMHSVAQDLDALKFYFSGGSNVLSGSTIRMYGIKAS